jgi:hypothetical protein
MEVSSGFGDEDAHPAAAPQHQHGPAQAVTVSGSPPSARQDGSASHSLCGGILAGLSPAVGSSESHVTLTSTCSYICTLSDLTVCWLDKMQRSCVVVLFGGTRGAGLTPAGHTQVS